MGQLDEIAKECARDKVKFSRKLGDKRICFATAYCEVAYRKFCHYQQNPKHSQTNSQYYNRFYICCCKGSFKAFKKGF